MREVQEACRRGREEVLLLLRVHLELLRHPLVVPVRDLPLACRKSDSLMLLVVVLVLSQIVVVICFVAHSLFV